MIDMTTKKSLFVNGQNVIKISIGDTVVWKKTAIGTYEVIAEAIYSNPDGKNRQLCLAFEICGIGDMYINGIFALSINNPTLGIIKYTEVTLNERYTISFVGAFEQISCVSSLSDQGGPAATGTKLIEVLKWDETRISTYNSQFYYTGANCANLIIPSFITTITDKTFCYSTFSTLTIPSQINKIGVGAFAYTESLRTLRFEQPSGMEVSLPTAGSNTLTPGMAYAKNAKTMTIYTDNETIKNYDWATDNITATFYHLDGSAWEA